MKAIFSNILGVIAFLAMYALISCADFLVELIYNAVRG